jgi:hypothetical protein
MRTNPDYETDALTTRTPFCGGSGALEGGVGVQHARREVWIIGLDGALDVGARVVLPGDLDRRFRGGDVDDDQSIEVELVDERRVVRPELLDEVGRAPVAV